MSVTIECFHTATHFFVKSVSCRSAKFTAGDFDCMVCLKKFTLQKLIIFFCPGNGKFWLSAFIYSAFVRATSIRVQLVARVPRVGHPYFRVKFYDKS